MTWLDVARFERRPLVFVEDHLYHTSEVLAAVHAARPDLMSCITVVALEGPGPDTDATVGDWLTRYPALQIVASVPERARAAAIAPSDLADASAYARLVARLLRPDGVLIQDIQLSTLSFLPADRWWESIYLAATVRGLFANRAPTVRFLSNKRGYSATFGRDLMDAGFDPRDVMDKSSIAHTVVPAIVSLFDRAFPLTLDAVLAPGPAKRWPIASQDAERREIDETLDIVLWLGADGAELSGRLVAGGRVTLRPASPEIDTWNALLAERLQGGDGVPVIDVGTRLGPPGAERAELTNLAARHIYTLRGRLVDQDAITTARHAYRLGPDVRAGLVTPRDTRRAQNRKSTPTDERVKSSLPGESSTSCTPKSSTSSKVRK